MFMGKLGRKPYIPFVNIFLFIHFHHIYVIQYTDLFTLTITKLYLVYFFMFMGTLGRNCHFNFHSMESSSQLNFHYREFKTFFIQNQRSSIPKVLVNRFLEHDGMRGLSCALFSSCMIGYTMMTTLS